MSRAVSSNSAVSLLVALFFVFVIVYLDQGSILQSLSNLVITGIQKGCRDLSQGKQLAVADVLSFVLGEGVKKNGSIGGQIRSACGIRPFCLVQVEQPVA